MTQPEDLDYQIDGRQKIAKTDDLRVQILTLEQGEEIPWHYRTGDAFGSQYSGRFFCRAMHGYPRAGLAEIVN